MSRDHETGQATLRIRPQNGDTVYMETEGTATVSSKKLEEYDIKTNALKLSFLCADSRGAHATGEAVSWTNAIFVKHRFYQRNRGDIIPISGRSMTIIVIMSPEFPSNFPKVRQVPIRVLSVYQGIKKRNLS